MLTLLSNLRVATMAGSSPDYGMIDDGAVLVEDGRIIWVGPQNELPDRYDGAHREDFEGRLATPGLIDCHTHVVFAGNRAHEFEMRLEGASYEEVAKAGGGIVSTVKHTRAADDTELLATALVRVDRMIDHGVTTLEIKSGYGLDVETELKMLRVARQIERQRPVSVVTSFLGAHATPPEYAGHNDAYIDEIAIPALEAANNEGLIDAVDGFCEGIAFNPAQIARVFERAGELGLPVKLHAEQLSNLGGAIMAAKFGATSVDHLEYLDQPGVDAIAKSGSVAVLLPGAFYTLRETQAPPVERLRNAGVAMAVATDCNPGSSPLQALLLAMNMACTLFRLTPQEALAGVTRHAARALGLSDRGAIAPGKRADLAVWDVKEPAELSYNIGANPLHKRIFGAG